MTITASLQVEYKDVPQYTDLELECQSVVKPFRMIWSYSKDDGATWEELETPNKANMKYTITGITDQNDGEI